MSSEYMRWFADYDKSLSSYWDDDEIYKPHKGENESDTEFCYFRKGWVPIWWEITLSKVDIGDGEGDKVHVGDGYNVVQTNNIAK